MDRDHPRYMLANCIFNETANTLLLGVTCKNPGRLHDRDAHLQRLLVLNARRTREPTGGFHSRGRRRGGRAYEVCRVYLYLGAPPCAHLAQGHLRVLEKQAVLHVPEAHGDAGRVGNSVCADVEYVRGVRACRRAQHKLESVFSVELQAGQLRRRVREWGWDRGEALAVAVYVKRPQLRGRELDRRPFQRHGCLGDVSQLQNASSMITGLERAYPGAPQASGSLVFSCHISPRCPSADSRTPRRVSSPLHGSG